MEPWRFRAFGMPPAGKCTWMSSPLKGSLRWVRPGPVSDRSRDLPGVFLSKVGGYMGYMMLYVSYMGYPHQESNQNF